MSKYDNYGGASYDKAFDGGDVSEWSPLDGLDIDDADWEEVYSDPTGWNEAEVIALVWAVEVPSHDSEGNVEDEPYVLPEQFIGQSVVYVAGAYWDWGHSCDGSYEACPRGTTLERAQSLARKACAMPLDGACCFLTCDDDWLPGNPEFLFDESDPGNKVVVLRYWKQGQLDPYDSEPIGFDDDPSSAVWQYACEMGWETTPPNQ